MVVSHRAVFSIALPMTLAHLSTPMIGLADSAVIGRLGDPALLGAVAIGAILFDFLFWGFGFLRMGTAGLTAQALGAEDKPEQTALLFRALGLALLLGFGMIALQHAIAWAAFRLSGASDGVAEAAWLYFDIRIWAAPLTLANYAILGWLIGMGRTTLGLVLQVGTNCCNVGLNILLTIGQGWGIAGVAYGTVIAEGLGCAAGLAIVLALAGKRPPAALILNSGKLLRMAALNRDILIRTLALLFAFAFFTRQGALKGDVTLAANAVLNNLFLVGGYFLDGIATAAEQLCGRAIGARNRAAFRRAVKLSIGWSYALAAGMSALLWFGGGILIDFLTTSEAVRTEARHYLIFAALTPLAGAHAFTHDGIYIGATWNVPMRNLMLGALALYILLWWLLQPWGNTGLWLALLGFLLVRGIGQELAFGMLERRTFAPL
jgi:multidrug resistance protein, MATE family